MRLIMQAPRCAVHCGGNFNQRVKLLRLCSHVANRNVRTLKLCAG
jgi:hypothetical protein